MADGKKNKIHWIYILLIVAATVFSLLGVIVIVPEIIESARVRKEITASVSLARENGFVHDYYYVDGKYLVYNNKVYSVRDCDDFQKLLDDGTLFMIEAP